MKCHYHPKIDAEAQCVVCGRNLCGACVQMEADQIYCRGCKRNIVHPVGNKNVVLSSGACGAIAGLVSIIPGFNLLNCVFCLWITGGGALAVFLAKRISNIKGRIAVQKAALAGCITGLVASLIAWVAEEIFTLASFELLYEAYAIFEGPMLLFHAAVRTVLFIFFGALAGIISNELIL